MRSVALLVLLVLTVAAAGCHDPPASSDAGLPPDPLPCEGDSFLRAVLQFPGEAPFDTGCLALSTPLGVTYLDFRCVLEGACLRAMGPTYMVGVCGERGWYQTAGPGTGWFSVTVQAGGAPLCYGGGSHCYYNANRPRSCSLEVIRTGTAPGDVVEARLAEPCALVDGDDVEGRVAPTVRDLRVRSPLVLSPELTPDAGLRCLDGSMP